MATNHIDALNKLLRGEISAVETYRQAISKLTGSENAALRPALEKMQQDHTAAVSKLGQFVSKAGGTPETSSGAWGSFANLVEGTAQLFGDSAALKALKEGEEHGLKDYENQLDSFDADARAWVTGTAIPATRSHIQTLDGLISKA